MPISAWWPPDSRAATIPTSVAAEDHPGPRRDGEDGGHGGGEPGEVVPDLVPQAGRRRRRRSAAASGTSSAAASWRWAGAAATTAASAASCCPALTLLGFRLQPRIGRKTRSALRVGGLNHIRNSPGDGRGHAHDGQAQDGESGGGDDGADGRADHEDQLGGDRIQGEGRAPLLPGGQHAQRLADDAEDRQGQQSADEDQRQQQLVGHVRHDGPDDGLGDDGRDEGPAQAHGVNATRPATGAPTAMPMVMTAAAAPAAA